VCLGTPQHCYRCKHKRWTLRRNGAECVLVSRQCEECNLFLEVQMASQVGRDCAAAALARDK